VIPCRDLKQFLAEVRENPAISHLCCASISPFWKLTLPEVQIGSWVLPRVLRLNSLGHQLRGASQERFEVFEKVAGGV
jgi:hypothetical protein